MSVTEVQKIPNTIKTLEGAAQDILEKNYGEAFADPKKFCKPFTDKEKCEKTILEQRKDYHKKLQKANPGITHPGMADIRTWPPRRIRIWFKLGDSYIFPGPDPNYKVPEPDWEMPDALDLSLPSEKPDIEKPGPDTKPDGPEKITPRPPASISGRTKNRRKQVVADAKQLIEELKEPGLEELTKIARDLQNGIDITNKAKTERKATHALNKLENIKIPKARETLKKYKEAL